MRRIFPLIFGLHDRISRSCYATVGVTLAVIKYLVDSTVIYRVSGIRWEPWDYPVHDLLGTQTAQIPSGVGIALLIWTLPFLWIGVSMTTRRAADAGWSPWLGLLFLVPFLNYVVMLVLCVAPSALGRVRSEPHTLPYVRSRFRGALAGLGAGLVVGLLGVGLDVGVTNRYDGALFIVTPFVLGVTSAFVFNRHADETMEATIGVVTLSLFLVGGALIAFALEGLVCLVLAFPLALALGALGAILGRSLAQRTDAGMSRPAGMMLGLLAIPATVLTNSVTPTEPTYLATTAVTVDAPPEVVWRHVVQFHDIQQRPDLLFRLGLAYPLRARIAGTGVGAIRRCEFSTGAFVEPITTWSAPTQLAFDVIQQPAPLQEWSPYQHVYAPHLHGFFRSTRGEFLLTPVSGGRTRLEGRTWYQLDIYPRGYWRFITDGIVSRIHRRVLMQVAREAEAEERTDVHRVLIPRDQ